jgi:putative transcriptional regulator
MSKTTIIAKIRPDGSVVGVLADGRERPLPDTPMRPMTPEEIEEAARADPDARPMTAEQLAKAHRTPRVKTLRRALGLTQEEFAAGYKIPLGTLRDWEQGRSEPDQPARAYLTVIARDPDGVRRSLESGRLSVSNEPLAPSPSYLLFAQAIVERKQILCSYNGYPRELCPIILGHSQGQERALTYQFGGESESDLPDWKCLSLAKVSDVQLREGPWHAGGSHTQRQGCVKVVDLDVNPASPYNPKRRLRS